MNFRNRDIVMLLGAGASKDAGVLTSLDMIEAIENLLDGECRDFKELYHYIKSSIYFGDGIGGRFNDTVNYNIERLVNALSELEKKEEHTIYPFIGNWNMKLLELANPAFSKVSDLKREILKQLKERWIPLKDYRTAAYYGRLIELKNEFTFPLRIFSLNYDLCLERNIEANVEMGFDENRRWDWRRFEEGENTASVDIFLYKMHGSINWLRDGNGNLTFWDEPAMINIDNLDIIFGTNYKLQYIDPYLFSAYEFRKYSLDAKLILSIGYSFGDDHVNGIIRQSLRNNLGTRLLAVSKNADAGKIAKSLGLQSEEQIIVRKSGAKMYMENELSLENLSKLFPDDQDIIQTTT